MKKIFFLINILILFFYQLSAQNKVFYAGEELNYKVYYGWINAGKAKLILEETKFNDKDFFHAKAIGYSTGITDKLYKVYDVYESFFDKKTCFPEKSIRNISESSYRSYNEVIYNHKENSLLSTKSGLHENLPSPIFDMLSAFYSIRINKFNDLEIGDILEINTFFSDKNFLLRIRFIGIEKIKTDLGKFECYKFSPVVEVGRVFDTKDDVSIWISKDENFIPIRIRFNLFLGSINCDLENYKLK
ncbi:MAG: hypothetical protein B6I24_02840 [Bacteroidetes bacterium 4572_128]|nr:MAG: hypothetical protein B6I24_02840 [Bacteroidetes bacterium 4572_128]